MSSYFVVDHVTDGNKRDGLVESYQMVPVQYDNGQGALVTGYKRMNFVHWPAIPSPFVHEEWSEDLVFSNIYTPEDDIADDEDEDGDEDYDFAGEDDETFDGEEGEQAIEAEG